MMLRLFVLVFLLLLCYSPVVAEQVDDCEEEGDEEEPIRVVEDTAAVPMVSD